jgi:type IV secretory pathway TrbL component
MKHAMILLAVVLIVIWMVARVALAVTSVALHLLWVAAIILAIVWLIGRLKS